jgi:hypothetical protein
MKSVYMKYSLDLDLLGSIYIENKCKNTIYAQNLYAAMCNNRFEKAGLEWTTSWRGAGGIIADIRNCREDYMDWYCTGIYLDEHGYVSEGTVTEEIAMDLFRLGWTVRKYKQ